MTQLRFGCNCEDSAVQSPNDDAAKKSQKSHRYKWILVLVRLRTNISLKHCCHARHSGEEREANVRLRFEEEATRTLVCAFESRGARNPSIDIGTKEEHSSIVCPIRRSHHCAFRDKQKTGSITPLIDSECTQPNPRVQRRGPSLLSRARSIAF